MRIRLPVGRSLFLAAAMLFALVALLPLRLALDRFGADGRGLAARAAIGSVWLGALKEAQFGPIPLGDVEASLNSLPLLLGLVRMTLSRADAADPFEGAVTLSRHGFGVDDVTGRLRLGALFAPLPIATLDLEDFSAGFASGLCTRASGRVRAGVSGELPGIGAGPGLSGSPRCAGAAVLLPLASQSGLEQLDLRLFSDGRYRADLNVRPGDPAARDRLLAAGFRPAGSGYVLRLDGAF